MATEKIKSLIDIHLDVGHDSIGWAVSGKNEHGGLVFPGTGVVLFQADDCLASQRRAFRRQRRHIRATRKRIERLAAFLLDRKVLSAEEIKANPTSAPWKLAANVLKQRKTLSWLELWAVLRWYAHNRGYDGNALWGRGLDEADEDDRKSLEAAKGLMTQHGTASMAETVCAEIGVNPAGEKSAGNGYFKGNKVSFDRKLVSGEVRQILEQHLGVLKGLDREMIEIILADPIKKPDFLRGTALPFRLPKRYFGGLLFGQLAPRFDNRIIGKCPKTGDKLPMKSTPEFLDYRWAMMLANVRVGYEKRPLSTDEITKLNETVARVGGFTKGEFKKAVRGITLKSDDNLDALLTAPEADETLTRYPGLLSLSKWKLQEILPEKELKRLAHRLFRKKTILLKEIEPLVPSENRWRFAEVIEANVGKGKKKKTKQEILETRLQAKIPDGRAPYSKEVMRKAVDSVFSGKDPRSENGILYRDAHQEDFLQEKDIDRATNNHLVRHRIKILLRLVRDIVRDYAENNPARISGVTLELARDLKDLSGKTNKEIESELGLRTAHHKATAKKLAKELGIDERLVSASFIRKGRIADDLDFTCPYTGRKYDLVEVRSKSVDLDHILPRSQRISDSLDSLALTFTEVNRMKGNRTALAFIREYEGMKVPGRENLSILSESAYLKLLEKFPTRGTHNDDVKRRKRRIEKLKKLNVSDMGMTDGMLTRTSHITSLARFALNGYFKKAGNRPQFYNPPGSVTAMLRREWNILGLLAESDKRIVDENGELLHKQEIRAVTHMHHAVDAITLGLASVYFPQDGNVWALMCKRHLNEQEQMVLRKTGMFTISNSGNIYLKSLAEATRISIISALAEQRVVVHIPSRKNGLKVQQNPWGIVAVDGEEKTLKIRQRKRDEKTGKIEIKCDTIPIKKAFGFEPENAQEGKLKKNKSILQYDTNYAVALDPVPTMIRYHKVWQQLGELKQKNNGIMPRLIRRSDLIHVPKGRYQGVWKVASIKDDATKGILFDMMKPHVVKFISKAEGIQRDIRLTTLLKDGVRVLPKIYTGVSLCPTMSLTSPQPAQQSSAETSS